MTNITWCRKHPWKTYDKDQFEGCYKCHLEKEKTLRFKNGSEIELGDVAKEDKLEGFASQKDYEESNEGNPDFVNTREE